ncbi:MAG: LptE family protein [Thermoanaerobaculaceae bacterium]|jgi:outer membrane lipopolysaccharide assembly protein LptE/RlpB|nr:LptE family protein [Thermoanaerobaculaceae bacterium]
MGRPVRLGAAGLLLAGVALAVAGCGYHLVGVSGNLPPTLHKLHVAPFVNRTGRAELDQRLTEEVTQEWLRRSRFQLVSSADEADAVLSGAVVSANVAPVRFDEQGRATEYQLTVAADVQLVDRTGEQPVVLWRDPNFSRTVSYQVDVSAVSYFDREIEAMEQVARDFARGLVVTILEGF